MRVLPAAETTAAPDGVEATGGIRVAWLGEPARAERLDVGVVTVDAGVATPPHVHLQGQVIVVTDGAGWVETDGERVELAPGDVVIAEPGELHTHGASATVAFTHLTVTTGDYVLPAEAGE